MGILLQSHAPTTNVDTLFNPLSLWRWLPTVHFDQGRQLNDGDNKKIRSKFFLLYNKFSNHWFPPTKDYDTSPKWSIPDFRKTTNFIAVVTEHHQHPFLLVEIKPPSDFQLDLRCNAAISPVIQCLDEIGAKQSAYAD